MTATSTLTEFTWHPQPDAAAFVQRIIDGFKVERFAARLQVETGTRLIDWVDHFSLHPSRKLNAELTAIGYREVGDCTWKNETGIFPRFYVSRAVKFPSIFLKVDSVEDFLEALKPHGLLNDHEPIGGPGASIRYVEMSEDHFGDGLGLFGVVERHGNPSLIFKSPLEHDVACVARHAERLHQRQRTFPNDADGFHYARKLIQAAADDLGMPRACDLFFRAERAYWQSRNRAAQIQKMRQDALGLGWANHDHHTYRSSREHFKEMISVFEMMGFKCRERFYAGKEAGWGAQVLEDPMTGVVIFADVDLSPEEVAQDFSHEPLPPRDKLGTVGLWCKLHGEAFLQAGMHHLECQFDFNAARDGLKEVGVDSMKPFTDFAYLRQAFTKGEVWPVAEERIAALLEQKLITPQQGETFRAKGAVGSHLEILERNDGYKGFNQTGINEIIRDTDPRRLAEALGSGPSAPAH